MIEIVEIYETDYYGKTLKMLRTSDGQEWINGYDLGNAMEQDITEISRAYSEEVN